jgi:outer membrane protein
MKKSLTLLAVVMISAPVSAKDNSWIDVSPPSSSFSDGPFVRAGAGSWKSDFSGELGKFDTKVDNLGLDDENNTYFYLQYEHDMPTVPYLRLEHVNIKSSGSGTLTASYSIRNQTFTANTTVTTDIDVSFNDLVLYYKKTPIDFGIVLRQFDADASASSTSLTTNISDSGSVSGVLPMVYLQSRVNLPLSGLYAAADGKWISYDEQSVTDYRATLGYGMLLSDMAELGLEAGYRSLAIDLGDDEDYAGDVEMSGAYIGVTITNRF